MRTVKVCRFRNTVLEVEETRTSSGTLLWTTYSFLQKSRVIRLRTSDKTYNLSNIKKMLRNSFKSISSKNSTNSMPHAPKTHRSPEIMKKIGISTWTHDGFILKSVNPKLFTVQKNGKTKVFKRLKDAKSYVLACSMSQENFHSGDNN